MDETQAKGSAPPSGSGANAKTTDAKPSFWRRRPVILAGTIFIGLLFFFGLGHLAESLTHESTDDAFLDGNIVSVAPKVSGQVSKVLVDHNQMVKQGDVLVEIDPRDYEMQLEQKKAALLSAKENSRLLEASFQLLGTQVETAQATAKQSEAEAVANQASADQAIANLKRAEDLNQRKIISPQEYDAAKAAAASAVATLKAGQEKTASDKSKVAQAKAQLEAGHRAWDRAQAQTQQANVDVDQAQLNLSYTRITAPQAGRVTRKSVEAGDFVATGQKMMALVLDEIWVTANFKETQLKKIRVNQPVRISIDSLGGKTYAGHVQSIQAGSGAAFSLLPPENAVGNFVKVVQRVPVRISFDSAVEREHVLGPGMSVVPSVHTTGFEMPRWVVLVAAVVLALLASFIWTKAAARNGRG
jgi:membrane fusion protein (multidrug efflux system)